MSCSTPSKALEDRPEYQKAQKRLEKAQKTIQPYLPKPDKVPMPTRGKWTQNHSIIYRPYRPF